MDIALFARHTDYEWEIAPHGAMRVPAVIYADEALIRAMDHKVYEQVCNVATLPGIVKAAYAMPDAHWGYGFPIGGVAAFDPEEGGVVSAGGVGFDISCGVRYAYTGNVHNEAGDSTYCHHCGVKVIGRDWYNLTAWNLDQDGKCRDCGTACAGVFDTKPGTWGARRLPVRLANFAA